MTLSYRLIGTYSTDSANLDTRGRPGVQCRRI